MTMNTIGSSSAFAHASAGLDAEGQLALLVLENQDASHQQAIADKARAREDYLEASQREVDAMHEEADHIWTGALVGGALTVAAAAVQVADVLIEPGVGADGKVPKEAPWAEIGAGVLNGTSQPAIKVFGDSPAADDRAEAKRAATSAAEANWRMDDAKEAIDKSQTRTDKVLDWLTSEGANRASIETGIIAGFA
jgi:hypothetical protein